LKFKYIKYILTISIKMKNKTQKFMQDLVEIIKYIKNDNPELNGGAAMSEVVALYLYKVTRSVNIAIEKYNNNKEEFKNKLEETRKEIDDKRAIKKQIQYSDTDLSDSSNNAAIISDSDYKIIDDKIIDDKIIDDKIINYKIEI